MTADDLKHLRRIVFSRLEDAVKLRQITRVEVDPITGARKNVVEVVEKAIDPQLLTLAKHLGVFPSEKGNTTSHSRITPPGGTDTQPPRERLEEVLNQIRSRHEAYEKMSARKEPAAEIVLKPN